MKLWKVEIEAFPMIRGIYVNRKECYDFTGTATTAEIAGRQAVRAAKKDYLSQISIKKIECLGEKEFGR